MSEARTSVFLTDVKPETVNVSVNLEGDLVVLDLDGLTVYAPVAVIKEVLAQAQEKLSR
jgi:hypothetical protein